MSAGASATVASAVREVEHPRVGLAVPRLHPWHGTSPEEGEQALGVERRAEREAQRDRSWCRRLVAAPVARGPAQVGRCRCEHRPHGVVELADAGEPGGERGGGDRQVGGLEQQPCRVGALCPGERERAGSDLLGEHAVEVPLAVVHPLGETTDALAVDHAVGDEAHGPADDVGPHVPLR